MKETSPNRKMEGWQYPEYNEQRCLLLLDNKSVLISEQVVLKRGMDTKGEKCCVALT